MLTVNISITTVTSPRALVSDSLMEKTIINAPDVSSDQRHFCAWEGIKIKKAVAYRAEAAVRGT